MGTLELPNMALDMQNFGIDACVIEQVAKGMRWKAYYYLWYLGKSNDSMSWIVFFPSFHMTFAFRHSIENDIYSNTSNNIFIIHI